MIRHKLFLLVLLLFAPFEKVSAGVPIFYSNGEEVEKVRTFPQSDEYLFDFGDGKWHHVDLGILHEQFSIFWVPLFNYGEEKYVLYTEDKIDDVDITYLELTPSDLEYLQSEFIGIPDKPELPFWDAWGGKLVALGVIFFIVICKLGSSDDD